LINLIYIRAAIQQRTGKVLKLEEVRDLLFQEGLITRKEYSDENLVFRGYDQFFETDVADKTVEPVEYLIDVEPSYENDED
jgi:tRNA splicing ligase